MSKINPNSAAFPITENVYREGFPYLELTHEGINIRTYIATRLMAGMLADPNFIDIGNAVRQSIQAADLLIQELNKDSNE